MPPYVYQPLRKGHLRHERCMRLVTLLPASQDDRIQIQIDRVSVEGRVFPVYEALSYCWGDEIGLHEVDVVTPRTILRRFKPEKRNHNVTTLSIRKNLASALTHLRRKDTSRVLWIDAICLDQQNNMEKLLELPKMGDIYKRAKNVVIWLGPGSHGTAKAFKAMLNLGHQVQWLPKQNELISAKDCDESWKDWQAPSFELPFDYGTWLAIEEVISSEWFRRVWIWQEICLADHDSAIIQCGASVIPWKIFLNSIAFFDTDVGRSGGKLEVDRKRFRKSLQEVANLALIPISRHLLGLLGVTRRCNCTDPKDRIYGLLGLATQRDETKLLKRLNPNSEISSSQVYKDVATGEITIMRRLNVLWHCDSTAWRDDLPSWVPAWNTKLPYRDINLGMFGGGRGALETRDTFGKISNNVLTVQGVFCDTVASCSAVASETVTILEMASIIRAWYRSMNSGVNKSPQEDDHTLMALCHALTAGFVGNRYPERLKPASLDAGKAIMRNVLASTQDLDISSDIPLPNDSNMFIHHMNQSFAHRCLFRTKTGRIGLGPSHVRAGDEVVSIIGSKRLIMLRPNSSSNRENFRIVGVCFLYGFMDLEAILGPLPEGYSVQVGESCDDTWDMRFHCNRGDDSKPSPHDPRLEKTYEGWKSSRRHETTGAIVWDHVATGDASQSDPRHTDIEFLGKRGISIVDISIV